MAETLHLLSDLNNNFLGNAILSDVKGESFADKLDGYVINPYGEPEGTIKFLWSSALTIQETSDLDTFLASYNGSISGSKDHLEVIKLFNSSVSITSGAGWATIGHACLLDPTGLQKKIERVSIHLLFEYTSYILGGLGDCEIRLVQERVSDGQLTILIPATVLPNTQGDQMVLNWDPLELESSPGLLGDNGLCRYFIEARNNLSTVFDIRNCECEFVA